MVMVMVMIMVIVMAISNIKLPHLVKTEQLQCVSLWRLCGEGSFRWYLSGPRVRCWGHSKPTAGQYQEIPGSMHCERQCSYPDPATIKICCNN